MFKTKFRIVTDEHSGFECQQKVWWIPFWFQMDGTNTHRTIESAEEFIFKHINAGKVIIVYRQKNSTLIKENKNK